MLALVVKLTLAPALVAGRLGHRAGGLVGGLPVVAGPILLIYAVEQGEAFAAEAAAGAVLGIVSLVGFCLAYALAARHHSTAVALAAGWAAFGVGTVAFAAVTPSLAVSTALALTAVAGSLSPHLAGLLAPFPIITAVLAGFTQAHTGPGQAIELLSGLTTALVCFTAFFALLAALIDPVGAGWAFALATVGALACWGVLVAAYD